MSHFYAKIKGNRGQASRCGSKGSGINAQIGSWSGGVSVSLYWNDEYQKDWAVVSLIQWGGKGVDMLLYEGPVDRSPFPDLERLVGVDEEETNA